MTRAALLIFTLGALWARSAVAQVPTIVLDDALQGVALGLSANWGSSLEIDGDTFLAGSEGHGAQVRRKIGGAWVVEQDLPNLTFGKEAGFAVALDGNTACVGAPAIFGAPPGVAQVWERSGSQWTPTVELVPLDPNPGDLFGLDVAISGNWIAVGAPSAEVGGLVTGAVYLFERSGATWVQRDKVTAAIPTADAAFGGCVDLFGDTLACGQRQLTGPPYVSSSSAPGGVRIFRESNGWSPEADLLPPAEPATSAFGSTLDLDTDTLAVGAPWESSGGRAYVFRRSGANWTLEQALQGDPCSFSFGQGVSVEGTRLAVGGTGFPGCAISFQHSHSVWQPVVRYVTTVPGEDFGNAVALHGDDLLIGYSDAWLQSFFDDNGAFFALGIAAGPQTYCVGKLNSNGCVGQISFVGLPSSTEPIEFEVRSANTLPLVSGILFYGFGGTVAIPFLGGTLCVQPPLRRTAPASAGGNGNACSGAYAFDFQTLIQSGNDPLLVAGSEVWAQFWHRDTPDPFGVGLTDALAFAVWP